MEPIAYCTRRHADMRTRDESWVRWGPNSETVRVRLERLRLNHWEVRCEMARAKKTLKPKIAFSISHSKFRTIEASIDQSRRTFCILKSIERLHWIIVLLLLMLNYLKRNSKGCGRRRPDPLAIITSSSSSNFVGLLALSISLRLHDRSQSLTISHSSFVQTRKIKTHWQNELRPDQNP